MNRDESRAGVMGEGSAPGRHRVVIVDAGTSLAGYFISNPDNVPETVNAVRRRQS